MYKPVLGLNALKGTAESRPKSARSCYDDHMLSIRSVWTPPL